MPPKTKRLAVYSRVSTESQDVQMQAYAISAWLANHGHEYTEVVQYVDEGVSAAAKKRPAFDRMLKAVDAGKIAAVLVWRFDRASRSTIQLISLLERFKAQNTDFISIHEQVDTSTPHGKLMFTLIAALGEFERDIIRARTRAGLAARKAAGKKLGHAFKLTAEQRAEILLALGRGERQKDLATRYGVAQSVISKIGGALRASV